MIQCRNADADQYMIKMICLMESFLRFACKVKKTYSENKLESLNILEFLVSPSFQNQVTCVCNTSFCQSPVLNFWRIANDDSTPSFTTPSWRQFTEIDSQAEDRREKAFRYLQSWNYTVFRYFLHCSFITFSSSLKLFALDEKLGWLELKLMAKTIGWWAIERKSEGEGKKGAKDWGIRVLEKIGKKMSTARVDTN